MTSQRQAELAELGSELHRMWHEHRTRAEALDQLARRAGALWGVDVARVPQPVRAVIRAGLRLLLETAWGARHCRPGRCPAGAGGRHRNTGRGA